MFIQQALTDPFLYFSWTIFVIFSICCHEYAHTYTALRFGDDTAARSGHLTLNPLVQMGLQSLIILALFVLAWGSVPVSPGRVRSARKRAMISFAGPLINLLLCLLFSLLTVTAKTAGAPDIGKYFFIGGAVNGTGARAARRGLRHLRRAARRRCPAAGRTRDGAQYAGDPRACD